MLELNLLADERDLVRMRDGVRRLLRIGAHPAVQSIARAVALGNTGRPIAELEGGSPMARSTTGCSTDCSDAQHGAGSCRMGAPGVEDGRSVVDPDGRVRGIRALRVVDASIMPADCKANTNFTTIMIGEHIAARIKRAAAAPG